MNTQKMIDKLKAFERGNPDVAETIADLTYEMIYSPELIRMIFEAVKKSEQYGTNIYIKTTEYLKKIGG